MDIDELTTRVQNLEERAQRLEDERDLRDLLSRYGFTADMGHAQEYVDLFTPDGAIDAGSRFKDGRMEGREAIHDFITGPAHLAIQFSSQHHAVCGPIVFYIDGDEAQAEGYSLVIVRSEREKKKHREAWGTGWAIDIAGANVNRWHFRRVDGHWRIVERVNRPMGSEESRQVLTHTLGPFEQAPGRR